MKKIETKIDGVFIIEPECFGDNQMSKNVTVMPAKINKYSQKPIEIVSKKRVAAYARVSTDSDEQFTSYEAQIDYYTKLINSKPEWEFIRVYSDEGRKGR